LVAVLNDRVVGFILGECATGKVAIQHLLAVDPAYRLRGIGKQLKLAFEREMRRRGMVCILLYESGNKHWAHHLERHGYARGILVREYQKFL
jgi:GNAT superfamily N-acetyltransferase